MKLWPGTTQAGKQERDERTVVSLAHLRAMEFKARGFSFLPRQPVRSVLSGRHGSRLRGRGLNFEELRHYRPGDDIRSLDWKVTRRTGRPYVRVYTEERERSVQFIVDQRASMFFGSRNLMKSVVAAELAALGAWRVLAAGDRVGGIVVDDLGCHRTPARRSRDNLLRLLGILARSNQHLAAGQPPRPEQLNAAFENIARETPHDALLIYVGDGFGWDEHSDELLKRLSLHNDVVVVNVVDPAELELPPMDNLVVSDGELQISISGRQKDLQQRFRDSHRAHVERMLSILKRFGLPLITIDTVDDPQQQLMRALGARV